MTQQELDTIIERHQHGQDIETMRPKDDAKAVLDEWMSKYSKMAGKVMKEAA